MLIRGEKGKKMKMVKEGEGEKNRRRFCPGTVALQEIRKFQRMNSFLVRKLPFARWVREITSSREVTSVFRCQLCWLFRRQQRPMWSTCSKMPIYV